MSNSVQAYMTPSLYWSTYLFIKNRMILESVPYQPNSSPQNLYKGPPNGDL